MEFLKNHALEVAFGVESTGLTTVTGMGNIHDMQGYEGITFIAISGVVTTGTISLTPYSSPTTVTTDFTVISDISVSSTGADRLFVCELRKPLERYVKVLGAAAGTADKVGCVAIKYGPVRKAPVSQDTNYVAASDVTVGTT